MDLIKVNDPIAIRDAATLILWRTTGVGVQVLMGQRGANAAFMPSKYVFPGGAVDPADRLVALSTPLDETCFRRLGQNARARPETIAVAGIRELWEETGLALGEPGRWSCPPPEDEGHDWAGFAARTVRPSARGMHFLFRAITPPGRSRRFDARFFAVNAENVVGNTDDFSAASEELSHLHWIGLHDVRNLDLPFITEVVLAEVGAFLRDGPNPAGVPFFDNSGPVPTFRRLT